MTQIRKRIQNLENKFLPKSKILFMALHNGDTEEEVIKKYEEKNGKIDFSQIKEKCVFNIHPSISGKSNKSTLSILD